MDRRGGPEYNDEWMWAVMIGLVGFVWIWSSVYG